ncbi:hypothetical protein A3C77_03680 [Candidatus Giovannonibacteria bacterium RIFCSPHIGHO2_02_FULL_45_13]|nr:MAG: hypothetical protein A3C77_03680 [Candidatus Giovannonibacteria bacterium RIFCSPHIGHO2_02_FULL_45_13]
MQISEEFIKQPFWALSVEETFKILQTSQEGLSDEEAEKRLKIFGQNKIEEKKRLARLKIILNQFKSPLIFVLIIAGALTIFLKEWVNAGVIFATVLVNAALGFWQENKAEVVLALLKSYVKTRSRIKRNGREREIDAEELVPGDIIRITQGDRIPADARLIFTNNFEVDESVLTGESLPQEKNAATLTFEMALPDRKSMVFLGTLAAGGFADAVVVATGKETEFGKIAALTEEGTELTPLQRAILNFSKKAGGIILALTLTLFLTGIYLGENLYEMFLIAVAVAVSAIPEGLPVALTVILAVGVERLAGKNGIVRKLLAAETLGSATLVLTDKTGTLTEAKMMLTAVESFQNTGNEAIKEILALSLANTDVILENPAEDSVNWRLAGKALDIALAMGAAKFGVFLPEILKDFRVLDRLPFNSESKFSASIFQKKSETFLALVGAPEILLKYSSVSAEDKKKIEEAVNKRAFSGERVLGVASKKLEENHEKILHQKHFNYLEFKGLIFFRDPLRPGVKDAIAKIQRAGVKTIIVTGDHRGTADAVARELGMIDGKGAVLTGEDLAHLSKEELKNRAGSISVFARVTPEQKLMLTKLYQEQGEVVAVTGDGVNDAPALQAADIGIAIGSGTDVAKGAADLVMLDDNFETIVSAIEEGRKILGNIRKVIVYLLSSSLDELMLIGGALLAGLALPINALQILFVNFFSDSFPAIALAFEKETDGFHKKPESAQKSVFDKEIKFLVLVIGIATSFLLFVLYFFLLKLNFAEELVRTFIFASFSTYTLLLAFSIRSLERGILSYNPFSNYYLVVGVIIGFSLTAIVIYVPFLQKIFSTSSLPPLWLLGVFGIGFINILAVEAGKWLFRKKIL